MNQRRRGTAVSFFRFAAAACAGLWVMGCQRPAAPQGPTESVVQPEELELLWDAALSVLRKFDFQPDRQDRTAGIITTRATTSAQWHEPWRQDVADPYSLAEASLQTIQRTATVRFIRDGDEWRIDVQVDVYRQSAPESQVTTASSAIHAFSGNLPTAEGRVFQAAEAERHWVHLGRDAALESRLLNRILAY